MAEMEVVEKLDKLKELQDILAEKYELEAKIEEAPLKLTSQEELLSRLKKQFIEKNSTYEEVRQKVVKLKVDLSEADAKREKCEKSMDNITTHREYEVLEKEIRDASELEQQLRKELQKEEKILDELNENLKQDEQLIASQEAELNAGKQSLLEETTALKAKLAEKDAQKDQIIPGIDPEIIYKFERIIKSKHGKGIVAVKGNVCDGCHMILPAQFANMVHGGDSIVFCPYCSRILYYEESIDGEEEFFNIEETGSLVGEDDYDDDYDEDLLDDEDGDDEDSRYED